MRNSTTAPRARRSLRRGLAHHEEPLLHDAKAHGPADWNAAKETYGSVLDNLVDEEELHTVMMMMIGQLNASHTGVGGEARRVERPASPDPLARLRAGRRS